MNKKWLITIIVAVVVILIAVPVGIILNIHNSEHDCSFEYQKVDNVVEEIARKHTYYEAKGKTVEIELNQDMINSLIKDYMESMDLGLPDNITLKEVMFDTKDQKIYINTKYGAMNAPLSAKVNVNLKEDGIDIAAEDLKLANMNAPGFVKNQIPESVMNYSFKYSDFDIPQVFGVKNVQFGSGYLKVQIELYEDEIVNLAMDYRDDLLDEIDKIKADQSGVASTFLDRLLSDEVLSEAKVEEYVTKALNNEELVNSAIYFATADDLEKYSDSINEGQQKVMDWVEPLKAIKYYGNIEDTVQNIINDQELKEFMTWFMPQEEVEEYTTTVDDYYGKYSGAKQTLSDAVAKLNEGKIDAAVNDILEKGDVKEFLALFVEDDVIDEYATEAENYYGTYNSARVSLEDAIAKVNEGNIDAAVDIILEKEDLKNFVALFVEQGVINDYSNQAEDCYNKYVNAKVSLEDAIAKLNDGKIDDALDNVLEKNDIKTFLALFVEEGVIDQYIADAENSYEKYNNAVASLQDVASRLKEGDIDAAVDKAIYKDDIKEFIALFVEREVIAEYTEDIDSYYKTYKDYYTQFENAKDSFESYVASVDTELIAENAEAFKASCAQVDDTQKYLIDLVDLIDTEGIKELAEAYEDDTGMIGTTIDYYHPYYWEETMAYVNALDETKANLKEYIRDLDLSSVEEVNMLVDDWSNFSIKLVEMLQEKDYQQVVDMFANNNYADAEMKAFVDKYFKEGVSLKGIRTFVENYIVWQQMTNDFMNKINNQQYNEAYEIFQQG